MEGDNKPTQTRDQFGKFIKVTSNTPPLTQKSSFKSEYPSLVDIRVTNPVTYLKLFFDKFFKNSEMSFTVRIRPMALISLAIAIAIILGGTGFSIFYAVGKMFGGFKN